MKKTRHESLLPVSHPCSSIPFPNELHVQYDKHLFVWITFKIIFRRPSKVTATFLPLPL